VAEVAVNKINELAGGQYTKWNETIYIGESFGNAVNARMSEQVGDTNKGTALILNAANPSAFASEQKPSYTSAFRKSTAIQTTSLMDESGFSIGHETILYVNPDCNGEECDNPGGAHTSGLRFFTCLLGGTDNHTGCGNIPQNPNLAKSLIENNWYTHIAFEPQSQPNGYDGCIYADGTFFITEEPVDCVSDLFVTVGSKQYYFESRAIKIVTLVRSIDPNDKIGPLGVREQRFVLPGNRLNYIINFENMKSATAPVQELFIEDDLDPNLDWTTVEFTEINYGRRALSIPDGVGVFEYSTRDIPPSSYVVGTAEEQLAIDINVSLNVQTGHIEWRMKLIDTATGDFPEDPFAGFLPPEDGTGQGQGFVTFSVKPKSDIVDGTVVTNKASIVFDTNEAIVTNQVSNTIGTPPPGFQIYLPLLQIAQ